jgi:hypothetical protein
MLLTMALLRLFLGWPTPTELIFDRIFPLLTVEFFIGSLVRAGGYTPLKLQGVSGALIGQLIVAGLGGVLYAFYLRRRDRRDVARTINGPLLDPRGWPLIIPGVLVATVLLVVLLWPTLVTNYRGFPPGPAHIIASLEMFISFSVCGLGIMFFYGLRLILFTENVLISPLPPCLHLFPRLCGEKPIQVASRQDSGPTRFAITAVKTSDAG